MSSQPSATIDSFELLFKQIEHKLSSKLPVDEKLLIRGKMKQRAFPRRQYLLQEGDVCRHMCYIVSGAGRVFSIDDKGFEHTMGLCLEDDWILDFESFHLQAGSRYYIEMLEKSRLLLLSNNDLMDLTRNAPLTGEALRLMEFERHIAALRRLHISMSLTATERYEDLKNNRPEFVSRFPQSMIASFLGITPETLSRIRRQTKPCLY